MAQLKDIRKDNTVQFTVHVSPGEAPDTKISITESETYGEIVSGCIYDIDLVAFMKKRNSEPGH